MYETFEECLRALLNQGQGGLITKDNNRFNYALPGQPEPEGDLYLGIYPSATPDVDWRVMFHGGPEAEAAYREFTANPENGDLSQTA
jgi:hypothetical protein